MAQISYPLPIYLKIKKMIKERFRDNHLCIRLKEQSFIEKILCCHNLLLKLFKVFMVLCLANILEQTRRDINFEIILRLDPTKSLLLPFHQNILN